MDAILNHGSRGIGRILNPELSGFIESFDEGVVTGWVYNTGADTPVTLRLIIDGWEVAAAVCDAAREDVLEAGYSRARAGFAFHVPDSYFDGHPHLGQLRTDANTLLSFVDADGFERDEWSFTLPRTDTRGQIDGWRDKTLFGWAVIIDRSTGAARPADFIVVRQSGRTLAVLAPTVARPDVAAQFGYPELCGFELSHAEVAHALDDAPLHCYVFPDHKEMANSPVAPPPAAGFRTVDALTAALAPAAQADAAAPDEADEIGLLQNAGLFDEAYYLKSYSDIAGNVSCSPFEHYFRYGFHEGRQPNFYFDTAWYVARNPDCAGQQPLLHYLLHGDAAGRDPGPFFDVAWYRAQNGLTPAENALAHYLRFHLERPLSPNPDFDAVYYAAKYPDVVAARVDLFAHYFCHGYKELRNPSAKFDVKFYVDRYLKGDYAANPLLHFWAHRSEPGVAGLPPAEEVSIAREIKKFCQPGPYFEEVQPPPADFKPQAMLLAYYLPQFHAFPENDAWWGKGFTEWTNVARGTPRFAGHYQPRVPRDLGFYTLDSAAVLRKQIDLALAAGLTGFVFYYYWFNGKRLMDQPLKHFLADKSLNMNFALMWANENWTRRWDGADAEVLISQDYRDADDAAMAAEFAAHFKDERYIRLQGRPVLMIYRAGVIPNVRQAISRWRGMFRDRFGEDPIFVMAQAFNAEDPRRFGFDGAIEFPPHKLTAGMTADNIRHHYLDADFSGSIYDYDKVVEASLGEAVPDFPLIKTAVPSWDNDARRQGAGLVITGSTPAKYEGWLAALVERAKANPFFGAPVVCVNAWNEWCEGAYLEPDLHFGAAYLNATARAISGRARSSHVPRLILLGHDAFPAGAQHLLLNLGRALRAASGMEFEFVLLEGGDLAKDYAAVAPLTIADTGKKLADKLRALAGSGFGHAIVNSTAAGMAVALLRAENIAPLLLVHELPRILREKQLIEHARTGIAQAGAVAFSSAFVRDALLRELDLPADERMRILPQGSYKNIRFDAAGRINVRAEFCLGDDDHLILGAGYADLRKGFDLFLQLWRQLREAPRRRGSGRIFAVWAGGIDPSLNEWLAQDIAAAEATGLFKMAGYRDDMAALFSAASVFALTSREDPLPTVVMEAISAGASVVAFDETGGIPDMLRGIGEGRIVPYGDVAAMARAVLAELPHRISPAARESRRAKITAAFDFADYARKLVKLAMPAAPDVSAVVPNYNYANYMPARLGSIFAQTYPVAEVVVLDDGSRDDSLDVIPAVAAAAGRAVRLIVNAVNSGSVFAQWRRAAETAQAEYIWIAEADDAADPEFLASLTALLAADPAMDLAFSDSRTVDAAGNPQWDSYKGYYASLEPDALRRTEVFAGDEFARRFVCVKNPILNVSAVVWRRAALLRALEACGSMIGEFRLAGDWLLYLAALAVPGARIGYEARTLNVHRRHAISVTHALEASRHVAEIARCHGIAADWFGLPPEMVAQQARYRAEVGAQLGAPPDVPIIG